MDTVKVEGPCPDCGSPAHLVENYVRGFWEVRCSHCPTFVWDESAEAAIQRWHQVTGVDERGA